jgi:hypothetical protein
LRERIGLFGDVIGKLQPILARAATFIERATLEVDSIEPVLADLAGADQLPEPPYDLAQLAPLLDRTELLPAAYDAQVLGPNQCTVRTEPGGVRARVTSDRELYEENLEDYEFWIWTYEAASFRQSIWLVMMYATVPIRARYVDFSAAERHTFSSSAQQRSISQPSRDTVG